jgi:RNA 2',3'-cyclic 3'-phosphodiesterase
MHRLFVAIRPPEQIRDLLVDAMDQSADFRWQDDEQLHLTLRFVGEVERPAADDLADALGRIRAAPLELRIAGVGRFEQRSSGALWAGVEPKPPLAALAAKVERVCQSIGLEPERRAFHPHITLAGRAGARARCTISSSGAAASRQRRSPSTSSSCSKAACRGTARITRRSRLTAFTEERFHPPPLPGERKSNRFGSNNRAPLSSLNTP